MTTASETSIDVPARPDEVWRTLTTDEGFEHWMGPGSTIDPQPGGPLIAADPIADDPKIGTVTRVDEPHHLGWAWRPLGDPDATTTEVDVVLSPTVQGTRVTVTESPSTHQVTTPVAQAPQAIASLTR